MKEIKNYTFEDLKSAKKVGYWTYSEKLNTYHSWRKKVRAEEKALARSKDSRIRRAKEKASPKTFVRKHWPERQLQLEPGLAVVIYAKIKMPEGIDHDFQVVRVSKK